MLNLIAKRVGVSGQDACCRFPPIAFVAGMRNNIFCVILALLVFAPGSRAQIPPTRRENCGALLSSVIAVCSQPTLARPDWCCNELKKWNDARYVNSYCSLFMAELEHENVGYLGKSFIRSPI